MASAGGHKTSMPRGYTHVGMAIHDTGRRAGRLWEFWETTADSTSQVRAVRGGRGRGSGRRRETRAGARHRARAANERALSTMGSPPDFFARTTWAGLSDVQVGKTWQQYVSATPHLAAACPKVGVGFFYYPSLKADLRGAKATAPIEKGEVICKMPISDMVSEFSVGNSSLRALAEELERESIAKHGLERTLSSSNASHATSAAMPRKRAACGGVQTAPGR